MTLRRYVGKRPPPVASVTKGMVTVDFVSETVECTKRIMTACRDIPDVLATTIADYARNSEEVVTYVSMSLEKRLISTESWKLDVDLMEMFDLYWTTNVPPSVPSLILESPLVGGDDALYPWQRTVVTAMVDKLRDPMVHVDDLDVVYEVFDGETGKTCRFARSGHVTFGRREEDVSSSRPTTVLTGCLLLDDMTTGKTRAVLEALAKLKGTIVPKSCPTRAPRDTMVIVTPSYKMASWKTEVEALRCFHDWKIVYLYTVEDFQKQKEDVDLLVVSRSTVTCSLRSSTSLFDRYLWTTQFHTVVYDAVESLVSSSSEFSLKRDTIILKTLFCGYHTILVSSCRTLLDNHRAVVGCLFLAGAYQNGVSIYPNPATYHDQLAFERDNEHLPAHKFFGGPFHHVHVEDKVHRQTCRHFLQHHVLRPPLWVPRPYQVVLKYEEDTGFLSTAGIPSREIEIINEISLHTFLSSKQVALVRLIAYLVVGKEDDDVQLLIYRGGAFENWPYLTEILKKRHHIHVTVFDGANALTVKRRKRKVDGSVLQRNVILYQGHEKTSHFPFITHILVPDIPVNNAGWQKNYRQFIGRATRYGIMVKKPIAVFVLDQASS